MKMAKKNDIQWWVWVGLIALVFLITKTGFIGTLVTTCDNIEPTSLSEYQIAITNMSGTIAASQNQFTLNGDIYSTFTATTLPLGTFDLIEPGVNKSCSQVLADVAAGSNSSIYTSINSKQVLINEVDAFWCNYNNNMVLRADSTATITAYFNRFEVCISEEIEDVSDYVYNGSADACRALGGDWSSDNTCLCGDELLLTNETCDDSREDTGSYATGGEGLYTSTPGQIEGKVSTPTTTTTNREEGFTDQQKYAGFGAIILVIFLMYWLFEKGPDKGLIKKKRRGRKK